MHDKSAEIMSGMVSGQGTDLRNLRDEVARLADRVEVLEAEMFRVRREAERCRLH